MWSIIGTAVSGRTSLAPKNVVPGATVSRFVPRLSIVATSFAWLEDETPTTATIAPIPIAIPSADSPARSRRVRSPCSATPSSSRGGRRARSMRSRLGRLAVTVLTIAGSPGSARAAPLIHPWESVTCRPGYTPEPEIWT